MKRDKYDIDFVSTTSKIPWADKIAMSLNSGFAFNVTWVIFGYYLMFFYTDIVGISAATAGTIILAARLLDVITDPLIGYLIDNVCMKRGRFRSWMFVGIFPLTLSFVAVFTCIDGFSMGVKLAWAAVAYSIFGAIGATATYSPFTGMVMNMTKNPQERALVASLQGMFNGIANIVAATFFISMVKIFGDGSQSSQRGFFLAAVVMALIVGACAVFVIVISKKYELNRDGSVREHLLQSEHEPLLSQLKHLGSNRPVIILVTGQIIFQIMLAIRNGIMIYFFQYYLDMEGFYVTAIFWNTLALGVGALLLKPLIRVFGDTNRAYRIIMAVNAVLFAVMFFMVKGTSPESSAQSMHFGLLFAVFILNGLALGSYTSFATVLTLNTVDHSEYLAGRPQAGLIHASFGLSITLGAALGGFFFGHILTGIGYTANQAQSDSTLNGMLVVMFVVPAIMALVHFILQHFFGLTDKQVAAELQEIKAKKEKE